MIRQIQQIAVLQATYEKYRQVVMLKEMESNAAKQAKHFHLTKAEIADLKTKWPSAYIVQHLVETQETQTEAPSVQALQATNDTRIQ